MAMRLGYSTLGQPELSLEQCEDLAMEYGLGFLELRALNGNLDLPAHFQSLETKPERVPVRVLGSSLRLTEAETSEVCDFYRFMELAQRLRVPYVRVFGGGRDGEALSDGEFKRAAALVKEIRRRASEKGWQAEMLLETHGAFSIPGYCLELNRLLDEPLNLIWDSHHTWKIAKERLLKTWNALKPLIRHIHYKDSISVGGKSQYVLPGEGDFPTAELFALLRDGGYAAGVSLEWEKLWHPELPPLREALERFVVRTKP